ncbi:MAG: HD domain-containing protein [Geodermatophilaceae bacterium]
MPAVQPDLLARWTSVVGPGEASRGAWTDLVSRWSEPHRHYHGLAHLVAVLSIVDDHASTVDDADPVRLAAWYHDAVYDPTRTDNEERSAGLARTALSPLGLGTATVAEVCRLVMVTKTHRYDAADADAALLCDADLSILAAPPPVYVGYVNAIRAEYAHVPDSEFRVGRADVLTSLLARDRLFGTTGLVALEQPARDNMRAELALLRA